MARKPVADVSAWPSITVEGNLIAPAMIASIDRRQATEQSEADYGIRKGLTIREEISTAFRVGQSHVDAFAKLTNSSLEATRRFARDFLAETFGFNDLVPAHGAVAFLAGGCVPIVVAPPSDEKLDRRSQVLSTDRSRSPASALQDYLNDHDHALWGLVTNGAVIRLMRENPSLTRPAYIEADLSQIFANEDAASFALLWLLIHRSRFGGASAPTTDCALERWRDAGAREGEAARNRLAEQVEAALKALGSGFLEANPDLAAKLRSGEVNLTEWFNELLRFVYRLIFLMVAEDRNLLHPEKAAAQARWLYAEGYSLTNLRAQCVRGVTWDRRHDRFEGVKIVFRALAHGEDALALPPLGGLFSDDKLPHLKTARLPNHAFMGALYRLSWLDGKTGKVPVNWRAMETEELGSVYESLLELQPQLGDDGKTLNFASAAAEQKGNQRKTTGSYYTPDSLVQALLDTALDPVLDRTEAEADDPAAALMKLSVIDPACGSGHFLLAAARRIASRVARIRAEGTPTMADFRHAMRDVARACAYGVDRNPMAVELTKVALWIETVDPGLPLGFFDAQIRCGDSLLGVFDLKALEQGIPDAAYKALTGDDKDVAKHYVAKNRAEKAEREKIADGFRFARRADLMREFADLHAMPETTLAEVEAKAARLSALTAQGAASWTLARACDLYVAAFLLPKRKGGQFAGPDGLPRRGAETVPTSGTLWEWMRGVKPHGALFGAAVEAADAARAFHWPLEFPDVMATGGFEVVLGNPPWEVMQLSDKEYFATRKPEIAALAGAARKKAIEELEDSDPQAFLSFVVAKRSFDAGNEFARASGRFDLTARGKVNTYGLFAELFMNLARDRAGVIVPTGVATDATTAPFFAALVGTGRLARLVDFENRAGLFPAVDSRAKFSLLTMGRDEEAARFAFFLTAPAQMTEPERNFTLSPNAISTINPNTKTAPVFRSRADADLTAKIYSRVPVLIDEDKGAAGNPWGVEFRQGLFNMTSDSGLFRTAAELRDADSKREGTDWVSSTERYIPLYEAKMIDFFDHRAGGYAQRGDERGYRVLPETTIAEHADPDFELTPFYWIDEKLVIEAVEAIPWDKEWLLAFKDITSATNERTFIPALVPRWGIGNNLPLIFPLSVRNPLVIECFIGNISSLVFDFVVRQKAGGVHMNFFYVKQFPTLPPSFYTSARVEFITERVRELLYTSHSLAPFARDLGYDGPPFPWDEDRRALLRADLDAFYARAYSLDRDELRYILDPADVKGPDYPSETFRVLKEKETRQHGEYRTRCLVLEAWDRMEASGEFKALGM